MKKLLLTWMALVALVPVYAQSVASEAQHLNGSALRRSLPAEMFSGRASTAPIQKTDDPFITIYYWGSEDTVRNGFGNPPVYYPIDNSYATIGNIVSNQTSSTPNATSNRSSIGSYINGRVMVSSAGVLYNSFRNVADNAVSSIPLTYRVDSLIIQGFQRKNSSFIDEDTLRIIISEVDSFVSGGNVFMWPATNKPVQKPLISDQTLTNNARWFEFLDVPVGFGVGATVQSSVPKPFAALLEFRGAPGDTMFIGGGIYPRFEPNPDPGFIYFRTLSYKKGVYRRPFSSNASNNFNKWNVTDAPNSTTDTVNSGFWIWNSPFIQAIIDVNPPTSVDNDLIGKDLTALAAYPNPILRGNEVSIPFRTNAGGDATMTIHNLLGVEVFRKPLSRLPAGETTVDVSTATFSPGVYVAKVRTQFGAEVSTKFVVH